ncbi:MAG: NHL repeat-containing protein [Patulibacter sp.]|nr:NHL repeat-containing protein [Patulibacter sp.]
MLRVTRPGRALRRTGRALLASVLLATGMVAGAAVSASAAPFGTPMAASLLGEDPIAPGVFRFPQGVAVDPTNGNVFVADQYSGVIQVFNGYGQFRFRFGARALRGERGRLGVIGGISVDRSGHVWVLDSEYDRVQVFSAKDGQFLTSFGDSTKFRVSQYGTRDDSGIASGGLVVSQKTPTSSIIMWVADSGNDRLLRYVFNPQTLRPHGPPKSTGSKTPLDRPQGVGVNPGGTRVYVPDNRNHRVYVLNATTLERVHVFGVYGKQPGEFSAPYDAAVDAARPSQLYVADNLNGRVNVFDAVTLEYTGTFGGDGRRVGKFSIVRAVASNPAFRSGGVFVADSSNNRIQRVSRTGEILAAWGIHGRGAGYFTRPRGVMYHPDGRIFVADTFDSRIAQFDPDGTFVAQFGRISSATGHAAPGSAQDEMLLPSAVTVDTTGVIWVADSNNNRLVMYNRGGEVISSTRALGMRRPMGLAAAPDGSVYVASSFSNQILKFRRDAAPTVVRGIRRPSAVAVQADGTVYATSLRTVVNVTTGARIRSPEGKTTWDRPQGIAVARDGTMYVSELRPGTLQGSRVVRGEPIGDGAYRWEAIAGESSDIGGVMDPANLSLSPDERTLLVADAGNNRIMRLDAPGSAPPVTQTLSVALGGGPLRGRVYSEPQGIDCGTDCTQQIGFGRPVTLTVRAYSGSRFVGWGGACAAAGTAPQCTVAMNQAQQVAAIFEPVPPPPVKIRSLSVSPTRWHLTRTKTKTRRTLKSRQATRAQLRIRLNEPAKGRLEVLQARPGRKRGSGAGATCVKPRSGSRVSSNRRCTRFVRLPVTRTLRLLEGLTKAEVSSRIDGRTLSPGRYRLRLTVTDEAGNTAVDETKSITLTR